MAIDTPAGTGPVRPEPGVAQERVAPATSPGRQASRSEELLALVRRRGRIEVSESARVLSVSQETVRRELRKLEAQGLVRRSYGLAFPVETSSFESALSQRQESFPEEKARIAAEVARRLGEAQTIFVDEGFQPLLAARALPRDRELTVVTSSLPVATELSARANVQIIIIGGRVRGKTLGVVDGTAVDMLRTFRLDLGLIGANGVTVEDGLTTPDPAVARVKAAAVQVSRRRIFIGAHHKFGVTSFVRFAGLHDFEAMITGTELGSARARAFHAAGAEIVQV
ncbi:DeoR/GlpR family DNA-binding transcription regulator [Promicromonospora sp. CA-289599]|uniref:DeoR/GlpR family DNA-binding transcription regulator n=1 Tax=Promicromonospora sp. CA-289599 TaxID=3240014 RepID=UPI003D8C3B72